MDHTTYQIDPPVSGRYGADFPLPLMFHGYVLDVRLTERQLTSSEPGRLGTSSKTATEACSRMARRNRPPVVEQERLEWDQAGLRYQDRLIEVKASGRGQA